MYTSQLSWQTKLNFHLQLFMFYTTRVLKQEWKSVSEENFVRSQLQHHEKQLLHLRPIDNSTENILTRSEALQINPMLQQV